MKHYSKIKVIVMAGLLLVFYGCNKPAPLTPENPTKAILVFPVNNSLCNQGTDLTATTCTISFDWEEGDYTDTYELVVKNLTTGTTTTKNTSETNLSVTLERGKPYSWYIVSKSNSAEGTAQSETWKFYIAGEGQRYYAPFPAEIVTPAMADTVVSTNNMITLDWNGNDVDGDITGYDVYYGTTSNPALYKSNITSSIISDAPVTTNTIYFWKVITKDAHGNTSDTGVYQFRVL